MDDESPFDFRPSASVETLKARAELVNRIHAFFQEREFIHVETPLVSRDTVVDRHIDPVSLDRSSFQTDDRRGCVFLQTSPEFAMKRLIASGATAIYQVCKAFRQGESGSRHNPEFTMLEWYRTDDSYQQGIDLLADFGESILGLGRPRKITWRDAFIEHAEVDPLDATDEQLLEACRNNQVALNLDSTNLDSANLDSANGAPQDSGRPTREELLDMLMSEVIETRVSAEVPYIVTDWPADQAALAKVRTNEDGVEVAERFELFAAGLELANGYHELLDADELERRNAKVNQQRVADGKSELPGNSQLLRAMKSGLPSCCGVAVGVDRLAMVALGKRSIDEVLTFPFSKA